MKRKVLICTTLTMTVRLFLLDSIRLLQKMGCEVHVASNGEEQEVLECADKFYQIPFQRNPLSYKNLKASRILKKILQENDYVFVHFHTPVASFYGRVMSRKARVHGTKVLYTAHGFHFYKGAKPINWLCYYPVEKLLAGRTDCLITINNEDYRRAGQWKNNASLVMQHGVGVDSDKYFLLDEAQKKLRRQELGFNQNEFIIIYAAEFNHNKNQQMLIRALAQITADKPVRLLLAGAGELMEPCRVLAQKLCVADRVDFLGYRWDLDRILPACDLAVASSLREGLPVNLMEAMLCGLPVVASDNRGHRELVEQGETGYIVGCDDTRAMSMAITKYSNDEPLRQKHGARAVERIKQLYTLEKVNAELTELYTRYL